MRLAPTIGGTGVLGVATALYVAIWVAYYPPFSAIEDEVGFVNQALAWSRGSSSSEGAGLGVLADFAKVGDRHVGVRHPGRSLLALPFVAVGGVSAVYWSGLAIHLATTAVAASLLIRLGRSRAWAVLVLFHPTLALYSRTAMADGAAGAFLLAAARLYVSAPSVRNAMGVGLLVGVSATMRYQAAIALPVFAWTISRRAPSAARHGVACAAAGGLVGLLIVLYNELAFGNPIGHDVAARGSFGGEHALPNLLHYATSLALVWPLAIAAPFLDRSPLRTLFRALALIFLAFYCLYYFHDRGRSWVETAVIGQRFLQVILPIWGVVYADVVARYVNVRTERASVGVGLTVVVVLVGLTGLMFHRHDGHLRRMVDTRDAIVAIVPPGSLVVCNGTARKLFGIPRDGVPTYRFAPYDFHGQPCPIDAIVAAEREPWFLVILPKAPGDEVPDLLARRQAEHRMTRLSASVPELIVLRSGR